MKKTTFFKSLLVAAGLLVGTSGAWAGEVSTIYERGTTTAWSDDDLSDWTLATATSTTIDNGIKMVGTNAGYSATKTITTGAQSIVTLNATLTGGVAPGRDTSYDYIKIGGVTLKLFGQGQTASIDVDGTSYPLTSFSRGGTYSVTIVINKATGAVTYTVSGGSTGNGTATSSTAITDVQVGHFRGGREGYETTVNLQKIEITEETQSIETVDYTINYLFESTIIKTETGTNALGATIKAVSPITIEDVKYYATDEATTSMVLVKGTNELNVDLRKAYTDEVHINAVDADNNVLKTFTGTRVEGDGASTLFYTRGVKYNDKYYMLPAANENKVNYGRSMAYGDADINITYTLDETVTYYAEESELSKSRSFAAQGQVPERASGGNWQRMYASSQLWTAPLQSGTYDLYVSGRNQGGSTATLSVKVRLSDGTLIDTGKEVSIGSSGNTVVEIKDIEVFSGASIALVETTGYNSNIAIDYVIACKTADGATNVTTTIGGAGYSTFANSNTLDLDNISGATAYYASAVADGKVTLSEATGTVVAGTGLILKGTAGTEVTIPVAQTGSKIDGNLLVGCLVETEVAQDANSYVLVNNGGTAEFESLVNMGAKIPASKAYLKAPAADGARLSIVFDTTTGISTVAAQSVENDAVYNLQGQRVVNAQKGLFIINGKKVVLK